MIIDFTVENFRSIKNPATLSFVAQKGRRTAGRNGGAGQLTDDEIAAPRELLGRSIGLLPVTGIYGPNASGKSNVLLALELLLMNVCVEDSEGFKLFDPFLLDDELIKAPSKLQLRVFVGKSSFSYELHIDRSGIVLKEQLSYSPVTETRHRNRLLFSRDYDAAKSSHHTDTGKDFEGSHIQLLQSLRPHETFLSLLVNRFKIDVIEPLSQWFKTTHPGIWDGYGDIDQQGCLKLLSTIPSFHSRVVELVRQFDVGLVDIEVQKKDTKKGDSYFALSVHRNSSGKDIVWSFEDESLGTQRLLVVASYIVRAIEFGIPLIVDEFGANLHPHIAHHIVKLFQNPKTNPKGAQLIFTSHDTRLWRDQLLRRDQIWFTEKEADGGTRLFPLTDFKVRNDLSLEKAYLDGRFGAVPILPAPEDLLQEAAA